MNSNENDSSEEHNFTNRNHYSEYSNGNTLNNGNNIPVSLSLSSETSHSRRIPNESAIDTLRNDLNIVATELKNVTGNLNKWLVI